MTHFAKLDFTGTVVSVTEGKPEDDGTELQLCARTGDTYRQTYDDGTRKNFASVGYRYDVNRDAFIPPKPYPSWVLNETTCDWKPPVTYPDDGSFYIWNESTTSWDVRTDAPI